ncbi:taste receptor type 2 member 3 [Budorcas taxicolor]|uniref:Taste receptor type 2 n=1 Tax=Budorcas tibetana TaxID=3369737 RepID=A0A4Y1NP13_9CETA|nr:taste receptor type 2 member 3 [Budorcas taxicolor]AXF50406.1 bitter taste receptor T2R3 [Budorcas taxicolor tibetana]
MLRLSNLGFLVLTAIQFILGMLGNGFIGWVNGSSWFKSKRISLHDFIITNLAVSRIVLLWILLIDGVLLVFSPKLQDEGIIMQIIDVFWTFTNHLSIWLTTCVSVFYCLKVASFSHPMFLWLKWRVSRVVVWMLLSTLLLSCCSAISLIREFKIYSVLGGIDRTGNMTELFRRKEKEYKLIHVLGTLWDLPPLVISLISYFLLILSLGRHMRQMHQDCGSSRDPSTEAHRRAVRVILSFLFLFLLYYLSFSVLTSSYFLPATKTIAKIGEVITMFYLAGHSYVLILGNSKLKQMFVAMLRCEPGCLKPGSKGSVYP